MTPRKVKVQKVSGSHYCIFDKLKQEGYFDSGRLTSEMTIPASIVGRVIGKGGNNVLLQRVISSEVVISRQSETEGLEEVPVKIVRHFLQFNLHREKSGSCCTKQKKVTEWEK